MDITIDVILLAIALAFIIEGAVPLCFPNKWRNYVAKLAQEPVTNIRTMGLIVVSIGVILLLIFSR